MRLPVELVWLIPALPLAAAAIGAVTTYRQRRLVSGVALLGLGAAFVLSCMALATVLAQPAGAEPLVSNYGWMDLGRTMLFLGWILDPLSALMGVMVTGVGLLIFVFSLGYMKNDPNFARFFCFLSLFASAMLGIVYSNSLLQLFVCWELVGLASYLLIGFWFHKSSAAAAAKKAFLTTRVGDIGFLLGILWLADLQGSLLFYDLGGGILEAGALSKISGLMVGGLAASTAIGLLIFCGAVGKSGQFPLHVWLPDAMEGPTPVSALIHAATMVAAGVFLMARIYPLLAADLTRAVPLHALPVVAGVGAITALLGAVFASAQHDIKRVLAYSTVSQLGYMMLAIGVGSWVAAVFHLLTHACFKALLFLGAGSILHATHHQQDMRRMGNLRLPLRHTFAAFMIGALALAGAPLLFSGFWSKEAILHAAHASSRSHWPFYVALLGVFLTAFYMTRLLAEVFFSPGPRDYNLGKHPPHESPRVMTVPLFILAAASILVGFLGTPAWPWLQATLLGRVADWEPGRLLEGFGIMAFSTLLVGAGIGLGHHLYMKNPRMVAGERDAVEITHPRLWRWMSGRLWMDELYAASFGRAFSGLSRLGAFAERHIWEGLTKVFGAIGAFASLAGRQGDEDGVNESADRAAGTFAGAGRAYSSVQTGQIHGYLRTLAMAFAILALILILGVGR